MWYLDFPERNPDSNYTPPMARHIQTCDRWALHDLQPLAERTDPHSLLKRAERLLGIAEAIAGQAQGMPGDWHGDAGDRDDWGQRQTLAREALPYGGIPWARIE